MPNHRWPLTGIVDTRSLSQTAHHISDARWQQAIDVIQAKLHPKPPAVFRSSLDRALLTYHAMSALSRKSSRKRVKANLRRLLKAAQKVNDALNELDGTSAYLIDRVSTLSLSEMRHLVGPFIRTANRALLTAEGLAPPLDFALLNMGSKLADAVAEHFGEDLVVSTPDSLFGALLEVLLHEATGKEPKESGKAAQRVVKFWRDGRRT